MFSLFTREKAAAPVPQAEEKAVLKPSLRKSGKLKISDEQARYHREPPLIDYLPGLNICRPARAFCWMTACRWARCSTCCRSVRRAYGGAPGGDP